MFCHFATIFSTPFFFIDNPAESFVCEKIKVKLSRSQTMQRYRVTIPLVQNLPLTSKEEFRFGLARPGQTKAEHLF